MFNIFKRNTLAALALAATAAAGFAGCSQDRLVSQPLSLNTPDNVFVDAAGMQAALVTLARNLRNELEGDNAPILTEMLFSETNVEGTDDKAGPAVDLNLLINPDGVQVIDADHNKIYYYWSEGYNGIKYANTIIDRLPKATFTSDAQRKQILAQAIFHRAYRYYRLCNQFGDVPAVFHELTAPKLDFQTTKREVILARIKADLDSTVGYNNDAVQRGEVSKGAMYHLLTQINLSLGKFDDAIASANAIINGGTYALMTTHFGSSVPAYPPSAGLGIAGTPNTAAANVIWDLHRPENKGLGSNKEGIFFTIDHDGAGAYNYPNNDGMTTMRNCVPYYGGQTYPIVTPAGRAGVNDQVSNAELLMSNLVGRGIGRARPTNYSQFEIWTDPNDLRHKVGVNWYNMENLVYNQIAIKTAGDPSYLKPIQMFNAAGGLLVPDSIRTYFGWPQYKLFVPDASRTPMQGGHSDWYVYRIAETYLLRAEAYFWKGDLANAAADINAIRARAGCAPISAAQVNMGAILDERARELYYEEKRKTELTRIAFIFALTGKAAENGKVYTTAAISDNNYFYDRIIAHNNFYATNYVNKYGAKYTISPYHVLWPVPTQSIQANLYGHINQNKGYVGYESNVAPLTAIP